DRDGPKLQPFLDVFSPNSTDLSKLRARGAKLLMYHGWADPALSALGTISYYDEVVKKAGGRAQSDKFVELFMAPGMQHCMRNGPSGRSRAPTRRRRRRGAIPICLATTRTSTSTARRSSGRRNSTHAGSKTCRRRSWPRR